MRRQRRILFIEGTAGIGLMTDSSAGQVGVSMKILWKLSESINVGNESEIRISGNLLKGRECVSVENLREP
jgi:hypothetical protein